MKNVIILGSVRSGTSMLTATFRETEAYFGEDIMSPTVSNPYGYYECHKINRLNNQIIRKIIYRKAQFPLDRISRYFRPRIYRDKRCLMLAAPRHVPDISLSNKLINEMRSITSHSPLCLKDPRFSVTLPFWQPFLPQNTCFLVAFRAPFRTVDSMLRNAREIYDPPLPLDESWGLRLWYRNYRRLLYQFSNPENWFFVHDELMFSGEALPVLEKFVETDLNYDQINPLIRRSQSEAVQPSSQLRKQCLTLFEALKQRSRSDIQRFA
ncbi:MAG: hypothetical protein ACFBSF_15175 [Leptolyngbyaceae cyanobacterium]